MGAVSVGAVSAGLRHRDVEGAAGHVVVSELHHDHVAAAFTNLVADGEAVVANMANVHLLTRPDGTHDSNEEAFVD